MLKQAPRTKVTPERASTAGRKSAAITMRAGTFAVAGAVLSAFSAGVAHAVDAKALWEKHCIQCHGADGKGLTKMGKKLNIRDLTDPKIQAEATDEKIRANIRDGVKDATGKIRMKPAENVTDAEITALINHVRKLSSK